MKTDLVRIYFNAALGGLGGLLGWAVVALLAPLAPDNVFVKDALIGLAAGVCIGSAVGCAEGALASRSPRRALQGAAYGASLGAAGGVVGLVLGELLFGLTGGGVWPRALGWAVFGMAVGSSDGFAQRMPSRVRYGMLGGLLGGLLGGSSYERLTLVLIGSLGDRSLALAWAGAVGLIILGACIGALVGLVESLLRRAWLIFLNGRLEGQKRTLDPKQARVALGRSDACQIVLPGDPSAAATHAEIASRDGEFVIEPRDGGVTVERAGKAEPVTGPYPLRPGDRLQVGKTRLMFHAEEVNAS